MVFGEQDTNERFCGLLLWCGDAALRGLEKITHIPKVCYLRCKKTIDSSLKVKIDLC